jgi:hypothetical protein
MHGFGYFSRIDELKDASNELLEAAVISTEEEYTDEEQAELDNVTVVKIGDENYKTTGSAGNTPAEFDADEVEPQLGGMGLGTSCGIKKDMARTEGFQGSEVIDDASCNMAQEIADSNKIEKMGPESQLNEMFGEMFGKNFGAEKHIHDVSKPSTDVEIDVDGFKVKKGW